MKKIFLAVMVIIFASANSLAAEIEHYKLDPHHSSVSWTANHFGFSNPSGKFSEIEGSLILNEKNPTKSSINVVIKTNNLTTGYDKFDNHLKSDDFFNVEKYPTATFVSKKVTITGKNTAKVLGDLTLMGVTKPIVLNVKLNKLAIHPFLQKKTAGFTATANVKRSDFGINYGIPSIGDVIKILIESEANIVEDSAQ